MYCRIKPLLEKENCLEEEEELPADKMLKILKHSQLELTVPPSV